MKRKFIAILMALMLALALAACGGGEETILTGMVVSVDGTVITLMEMDSDAMGFAGEQRPEMPQGMEDFDGFFNSGVYDGTLPEGETFPQWQEGDFFEFEIPEGMEDMTMPENGQMPDFGGMDFGNFATEMETQKVEIGGAHISLEIDGGKASGSLEDIVPGTFVTITMNGKGEATYVLVSSQSGFGGGMFFQGNN